ncbi:MAG TPA: hypothetical protein VKS21_00645, partial [Spirochaetota bacterium]|nr:hypothetical protein [Spirochaetota bacterium]
AEVLGYYKKLRDQITAAGPVVSGRIGGTPEIHEKINRETGQGLVACFAPAVGSYTYLTHAKVKKCLWHSDNLKVTFLKSGHARLDCSLDGTDAALVFFS